MGNLLPVSDAAGGIRPGGKRIDQLVSLTLGQVCGITPELLIICFERLNRFDSSRLFHGSTSMIDYEIKDNHSFKIANLLRFASLEK